MDYKNKKRPRKYNHQYNVEFLDGLGHVVHLTFDNRSQALIEVISLISNGNIEVKFYHSVDDYTEELY